MSATAAAPIWSTQASAQTCVAFTTALGAGKLKVAASCFARDGALITPDLTAVHGRAGIRLVLAQLIAVRAEIAIEASSLLEAGDIIFARQRWRISSMGSGKDPFTQISSANLLLRRLGEGDWKLAIAAPWGWGSEVLSACQSQGGVG